MVTGERKATSTVTIASVATNRNTGAVRPCTHACRHTQDTCVCGTPTDLPTDRRTDRLPACLPACLPTRPTDCVHISTKKMREQKRFDIWSGKVYVCGHNEDEIELHKTSVKIRAPPQGGLCMWVRARVLDMFREITRVEISSKRSL